MKLLFPEGPFICIPGNFIPGDGLCLFAELLDDDTAVVSAET